MSGRLGDWLRGSTIGRGLAPIGARFEIVREFLWPVLETTITEESHKKWLADDYALIAKLKLSVDGGAALEEARRVADAEAERRRSADQKASTYLAVVAALAPLLLAGATAIWEKKAGSAPPAFNMLLLGIAVAYMAMAGIWSFRVLEVSASNRIGIGDIADSWKKREPAAALTRWILRCARANYRGVNEKVDKIKMAHAFLLRAFITFVLILLFNILFFISAALWPSNALPPDLWLASARAALVADQRLDRIENELRRAPAWRVVTPACGPRGARPLTGALVREQSIEPGMAMPPVADLFGWKPLRFREIRLTCESSSQLMLRIWDERPAALAERRAAADRRETVSLPPIDGMQVELRTQRLWPVVDNAAQDRLPPVLIRQLLVVRHPDGSLVAYAEADVGRESLGAPPR